MPPTDWTTRLSSAIPCGSSTISKAPTLPPDEPPVITRGSGCRVFDDAGREFIDFRNALGPITLGYRFPPVDHAIRTQLDAGILFGHPHPLECEVAELLQSIIPCAQNVRFLKTGGEALAACIRLARAYTNRDHVIHIGYNGWLNSLSPSSAPPPSFSRVACDARPPVPPGVPQCLSALHHAAPWNDLPALEQLFSQHDIAALVVAADYRHLAAGATFYPALRSLTQRHGTVLIFDEIVTGFRLANAGVQEYFNVTPDLAVFAKGIANGMPLSAYCGTKDLMQTARRATISTTYGGETLSLAAAKATLETYLNEHVVSHLWSAGETLWSQVNSLCKQHNLPIRLEGFYPCPAWTFPDPATRERFLRSAYRHGLSLYDVSYVNFSHKEPDITEALQRFDRTIQEVAAGG